MKILTDKENDYQKIKEVNSKDGYSMGVITYLEKWADLMEAKIEAGEKLIDIADKTSREADTDGITGFMYGAAVNILSKVWMHGEALRKWHNKEYNYEGDGCVNPAVLTLG